MVAFCQAVLHQPLAAPARFGPRRPRVRQAVDAVAAQHQVPVVACPRGQRTDEGAAWSRARCKADDGVVFLGRAQDKASSFTAAKRTGADGHRWVEFSRQPVAVTQV